MDWHALRSGAARRDHRGRGARRRDRRGAGAAHGQPAWTSCAAPAPPTRRPHRPADRGVAGRTELARAIRRAERQRPTAPVPPALRGQAALTDVAKDIRYACRLLRRTPGFTTRRAVDAGAWHRDDDGDLQRRAGGAAAAGAVPRARAPGADVGDRPQLRHDARARVDSGLRGLPAAQPPGGPRRRVRLLRREPGAGRAASRGGCRCSARLRSCCSCSASRTVAGRVFTADEDRPGGARRRADQRPPVGAALRARALGDRRADSPQRRPANHHRRGSADGGLRRAADPVGGRLRARLRRSRPADAGGRLAAAAAGSRHGLRAAATILPDGGPAGGRAPQWRRHTTRWCEWRPIWSAAIPTTTPAAARSWSGSTTWCWAARARR